MKRSYTIGFDAKHANQGSTTQSSYARFVIEALSDACPRNSYFRMYIERSKPHADYERLAKRHNVESMEPDGMLWRKLPGIWRLWHITKDMQRGDVDLYHSLSGSLPFGLSRCDIRSVTTIHSLEFLRLRRFFKPLHNLYRRLLILSSMHRADRIIAVSESVKRDITRYFHIDPDKIDVIYQGCHNRFTEPITDERIAILRERYNLPERYILVVGTHSTRKNLNTIIETLPNIDPSIHLVLAGRGTSNTAHIMHRVKSLDMENRVHMLHGVADEDMPALYSSALAYLMMSLYEGFSTTIIEAITVGTPVIAARGSSLEEAGGPSSIYVGPNDREALAKAIERIATDDALRQKMINDGRDYSTRFRHEVVAYNLINCYRRIGIDIRE